MSEYRRVTCPIEFENQTGEVPAINCCSQIPNPTAVLQMNQGIAHGSVPINPFTGLPINPAVADKSYMDALLKMEGERIKAQFDIEKQKLDYAHKKDLEILKSENRLRLEEKQAENIAKRLEGMQARTAERENASYAIFRDSESRLRLETRYPTRKSDYSEPIINSDSMQAYRICDVETHKTVAVLIKADNMPEKIVLAREDVNPRVFERCLSKRGLAVTTSRERRKLVLELLLSFLIDEAAVVELPKTVGWRKADTGWIFAESDAKTIEGVVRGCYEIKG